MNNMTDAERLQSWIDKGLVNVMTDEQLKELDKQYND